MTRRVAAVALTLALLAPGAALAADYEVAPGAPPAHLRTPSRCATDGGSVLSLPPGYFLTEATYSALDADLRRLGDAETRLKAENASLRQATVSKPAKTLLWVLGAAAAGFLVGALVY